MAKVIQITPATGGDDMRVLCDNGEIWRRHVQAGTEIKWTRIEGPYPDVIEPLEAPAPASPSDPQKRKGSLFDKKSAA